MKHLITPNRENEERQNEDREGNTKTTQKKKVHKNENYCYCVASERESLIVWAEGKGKTSMNDSFTPPQQYSRCTTRDDDTLTRQTTTSCGSKKILIFPSPPSRVV